ncbi:MAG: CPBP family glutamic-type intramembrane protease [Thermoanaerobaculia bacterium]
MPSFARVGSAAPPAFREPPRPGLLFAGLGSWVAATVVVSSFAAPPIFAAVEAMFPGRFPFLRVFRRVAMLAAIVFLVLWSRRVGARAPRDFGLASGGWRALLGGFLAGAATLGAAGALELWGGQRRWIGELRPAMILEAIVAAAAIGFVEQLVFHGLWLYPFGRLRGAAFAASCLATSALYATAHFARGSGRVARVDEWSGLSVWSGVPAAIARYGEAWLGLAAAAALLYAVAWRTGQVWGAVGLHSGAVLALKLASLVSRPVLSGASWFFVDGILPGWRLAILFVALVPVALLGGPGTWLARWARQPEMT